MAAVKKSVMVVRVNLVMGADVLRTRRSCMRMSYSTRLLALAVCVFAVIPLFPASASADEAYRITSGSVTVVCPLTIGGSFEAKTTALSGSVTPATGGAITGALVVELVKLETGISLRDRHLRNNYLEVQKGADFLVARIDNIKVEGLSGKTTFRGKLTLHGQQRDISGTADLQQDGKSYRVDATFPLSIAAFQIPKPTYLGVGVGDEITIRVNLTASSTAIATTSSR
jgi:polyisoprenoid-binding protein YceI